MRTTIYLIRHAEAESNVNPVHIGESNLTTDGFSQARAVAEKFKDKKIENIFTSNILRAQKTAEEMAGVVGIEPKSLEFLKEQRGAYSADLEFTPEEDFEIFKSRIIKTKNFLENLNGSNIVVSHAIFIKALLAYIMLGESADEKSILKISESLVIDNSTISKIVFNKEKGKWRVMSLNSPNVS